MIPEEKKRLQQIVEEYASHDNSPEVQALFTAWLTDGCNRRAKDEAMHRVWNAIPPKLDANTEREWQRLQARIAGHGFSQASHLGNRRRLITRVLRYAAVLMLPLVAAALTYILTRGQQSTELVNVELTEFSVPNGKLSSVILPDSSRVLLNAGSILIYPKQFGARRQVFLNGEAHFEVNANPEHPFVVSTTDMEITATGTAFDVSAYTDDGFSMATLEHGRLNVQLKSDPSQAVQTLNAGEQLLFHRKSRLSEKRNANMRDATAWHQGTLVMRRMGIEEMARLLERRFNLKVYVNAERYNNALITLKVMHDESFDKLMNVLQQLVPNLRYRMKDNELYIY